ncbi:MAG TPA: UPF0147 family protein [Thermoplasmata archaeon]|nr:UPF0147 family protein [Thermoplasmata archaeon]
MTATSPAASASSPAAPPTGADADPPALQSVFDALAELAEDSSVPRNIRRGAQSAREALAKPRAARDVRIASAVYLLDDLANDPNLPTHGRTAIWSIISSLESIA